MSVVLVIALVAVGLYAYNQHDQEQRLTGQVANLQQKNDALTATNNDLTTKNQTLATDGATLARASSLLANVVQQFNDLDTLSVGNDTNHLDLINWVKQNATFPTTAQLDEAYSRFGAFTTQEQATVAQYTTIKTSFTQTLDQLSGLLNIPPPTPTTGS